MSTPRPAIRSYEILEGTEAGGGQSIRCVVCRHTSHNANDVHNRYCVHCSLFHDDFTHLAVWLLRNGGDTDEFAAGLKPEVRDYLRQCLRRWSSTGSQTGER